MKGKIMKGQIISGDFSEIIIRKKQDSNLELGELLITENNYSKMLLQVKDLMYGSQISQQNLELISGMNLEEGEETNLSDKHLRLYTLAKLKNILTIKERKGNLPKNLPDVFGEVREVTKDDLFFITKPKEPLNVGKLRSGSKTLNVDIFLDATKALAHHILIPATTGRGKSNLLSCLLFDSLDKDFCGILVMDPHDEYYGRTEIGLKDHPLKNSISYYTSKNVPTGQNTLKINIKQIRPQHFNGVINWTQPQSEALYGFYKKYNNTWIEAIVKDLPLEGFQEGTIAVLKRRMLQLLDISHDSLKGTNVFDFDSGETTIKDITKDLENGKCVIIDTSNFSGAVEILIGSLITTEIYNKYKYYKKTGDITTKPVISIVLEEAPRVLGKDILEKGPNIFSTIAREGRKFKIGLCAVTQLPSLIPRQILANMNTKIILGLEMQAERQAIIESASQDLSDDSKTIASLDIGEALITSNFMKFAVPVKIPKFADIVKEYQNKHNREKHKISINELKK